MAAPGKAQLLNEVHTLLKRRYKLEPRPGRLTVLEAVVYGICHEGTTREQANQMLSRFKDDFFDWNEVRVSSVEEIQNVLAGVPDAEERARRIRKFLRQLFRKSYGFTLENLHKKPLKEAVKELAPYEALKSDYVLATVIQYALGGHAIPVDAPLRRALERLGATEPEVDDLALRATLERLVPKNRGAEFLDLLEELTHDTCVEVEPDCPRCELRKICPTGQERIAAGKAAARKEARKTASAPPPEPAPPAKATSRRKAGVEASAEEHPSPPAKAATRKTKPPKT